MKVLIMCEGANELAIVKILLQNDMLIYKEDDLLGLTPYFARQIAKSGQVRTELNIYSGKVDIIRIGDKQSDELKIPKEYREKINSVKKLCTKPELEMLLIIAEGKNSEYQRVKSKTKPKEYAKRNISYNGLKYDNSTRFYELYYGKRPQLLYDNIMEYRRINKGHEKNEGYLADLLQEGLK